MLPDANDIDVIFLQILNHSLHRCAV